MSSAPDAEPVGSVAEEAFKLFQALTVPSPEAEQAEQAEQAAPDDAPDADEHSCSTSWCPVCQIAGFVREHPEAVASVTRSAADLARSVRELIDSALTPQEPT